MFTNGRSEPLFHITTSDDKRRQIWLHLFATDTLPVIGPKPRWQEQQGGAGLAFDLALGNLSQMQRARFAGYLSRKYRVDYPTTLSELETAVSWPIPAGIDIQVLEPAEQSFPLAPLLQRLGRNRVPRPSLCPG